MHGGAGDGIFPLVCVSLSSFYYYLLFVLIRFCGSSDGGRRSLRSPVDRASGTVDCLSLRKCSIQGR